MKKGTENTRWLACLAMMTAIILVLSITGVGLIPIPLIRATTLHIPVILGAIVLGPLAGGILGAVFGLCSMWTATTAPTLLSFMFSPFLSTSGLPGALKAIWIALGCRILIGVVTGWVWIALRKFNANETIAMAIAAFLGSMTNTVCVMGSIYLLFAPQYAEALNVAGSAVVGLVLTTVVTSGIPEALIAVVLATALSKVIFKVTPEFRPTRAHIG